MTLRTRWLATLGAGLALGGAAIACATIGSTGQGDVDLPSAGVGPFRKLGPLETQDQAPFVLRDRDRQYREPAAAPLDDDPASTRVALFVVAVEKTDAGTADVIARTRADDARSFFGGAAEQQKVAGATQHTARTVLRADAAWEGGRVSGPSVLRIGGEWWLYYAGAGGIGLARSSDGFAFTKVAGPVLAVDASIAWEWSAPSAPSVARYPDGRFRMLYAAGGQIGEAASDDGITWTRVDADPSTPAIDPVLGVSASVAEASLVPGEKPPFDTGEVGDPLLLPRITPDGRLHVRVLYTGFDGPPGTSARASAVGFAARYGDSGRLVRNATPVYAVGQHEAAPALFAWNGGVLLYVQQSIAASDPNDAGPDGANYVPGYVSVAAAFAPPNLTLDVPSGFADSP